MSDFSTSWYKVRKSGGLDTTNCSVRRQFGRSQDNVWQALYGVVLKGMWSYRIGKRSFTDTRIFLKTGGLDRGQVIPE